MFETLETNFYPEPLTVKQEILRKNDLIDRSIRSWKTRAKLRIRTVRRMAKRVEYRKQLRLRAWKSKQKMYRYTLVDRIWQSKPKQFMYDLRGKLRKMQDWLNITLWYLLMCELRTTIQMSSWFCVFRKNPALYRKRLPRKLKAYKKKTQFLLT